MIFSKHNHKDPIRGSLGFQSLFLRGTRWTWSQKNWLMWKVFNHFLGCYPTVNPVTKKCCFLKIKDFYKTMCLVQVSVIFTESWLMFLSSCPTVLIYRKYWRKKKMVKYFEQDNPIFKGFPKIAPFSELFRKVPLFPKNWQFSWNNMPHP